MDDRWNEVVVGFIDVFPLNQMEHASAFQAMRACTVSQSLQHHDQVHLQLEVPAQISPFQSRCFHLISTFW